MKIILKEGRENKIMQPGIAYTVYAIYLNRLVEFMVLQEGCSSTPYAVPFEDVYVVDNRLSSFWVFTGQHKENAQNEVNHQVISFVEWAENSFFYQDLIEGREAGIIWRKYRYLMDMEFMDTKLTMQALDIGDGWVQCGKCNNAWLPEDKYEVVICPSCNTKQNRTIPQFRIR